MNNSSSDVQGILLVDKPKGKTSFSLVSVLRRVLGVKKIGHAGTLDPFATGVMVMLIGRQATKLSDQFLTSEKEYVATLHLGVATDTFDCDGKELSTSTIIPQQEDVNRVIARFQGEIEQVPPMFSAKKVNGKKLYELARQGKSIERLPVKIKVKTTFISYSYPNLTIHVTCSKGTYIRSIADEIGSLLGCGAHLTDLRRVRSGTFSIENCFLGAHLFSSDLDRDALYQSIKHANYL